MKKSILLVFFLVSMLNLNAQTRAEKRALKKQGKEIAYQKTKTLIKSRSFQFEALTAFPLGNDISKLNLIGTNGVFQGNTVNLIGNTNFIRLNKKELGVFMPYFGRVFRALSYGGTNTGIQTKGPIEDYDVEFYENKKRISVKFSSKNNSEQFQFYLLINYGGNTTLSVNGSNRQSISYHGKVTALEEGLLENKD